MSGCLKSDLASELERPASQSLQSLAARDLAGIAWSCAFARHSGSSSFMQLLGGVCEARVCQLSPRYLSNITWAFAKVAVKWPRGNSFSFWSMVAAQLQEYKPPELSSLIWAAANTSAQPFSSLQWTLLETRILSLASHHELGPQELSNVLWSFAHLLFLRGPTNTLLFDVAVAKFGELREQHVANLLWALATMRHSHQPFLDLAMTALPLPSRSFKPSEVMSIVWSLAKLHCASEMCEAVSFCISDDGLHELTSRSFSNLLWAVAHMQMTDLISTPEVIVATASRISPVCKPQEVANIAWALVKLNISTKPTMQVLEAQAQRMFNDFNPQNVTNFCWALAAEHLSNPGVWEQVREFVSRRISEFKAQEAANLCWSFAVVKRKIECLVVVDAYWLSADFGHHPSTILSLTWALHYLQVTDPRLDMAKSILLSHGRHLDGEAKKQDAIISLIHDGSGDRTSLEPHVSLDLWDRVAVCKPAGWEVEEKRKDYNDVGHVRSLSVFLRCSVSKSPPIWLDDDFHYGFIHRLDVPGSGLVLAAKTYQAFYDLQFQLQSGQICREYLALCHGWAPWTPETETHLEYSISSQLGAPSYVGKGKPSRTSLFLLARCIKPDTGDALSLMRVRIWTGRTHQIRVVWTQ
ncbi:unnamed protein product [Durusdinium trenchii]|uniref:Pseudouridine synthase RsuA/RluA-like domain-containing protein n=1 Tax=Durusdinium trenchii TaxID=1381693 RepID=A0ABP0P2N5_9DINO